MLPTDSLENLRAQLAEFAAQREWQQFHSPKNLSMALIGEAAEIIEHFQWLTEAESAQLPPEKLQAVGYELADVLLYLIRLADVLQLDLLEVAQEKLKINEQRYPVHLSRNCAKRATEL
jgi:NTP pyrophosphatase (non-canonical NTP hydrolase)